MINENIINELKAKHENVYVLTAKSGESIAVRSPNDPEWGLFQDDREKRGPRALKNLVRMCLLHPSQSELYEIFNRKPALANIFGARLVELAGLEEEAEVKKV